MKLVSEIPHNVCLCMYHSNAIEAVNSFQKYVINCPDYKHGFFESFLCTEITKNCWFSKCTDCSGVTKEKLINMIQNSPSTIPSSVKWIKWEKSTTANRIEKIEKREEMSKLVDHIIELSPKFLKHKFIKNEQATVFNTFDVPRAKDCERKDEGLLQIDFAENFVCESQDEVQTAHWNQRQLTLFTSALYYNDEITSKVYVSDNLQHTKETIIPLLYNYFLTMPKSIKCLKIWSDGPSSQFKNKFIAAIIPVFEKEFNIKIIWNYFATSHGKGCIDGIGAMAKKVVRKHVNTRECIVSSAEDFVKAFQLTPSKITVKEITSQEMDNINKKFKTKQLFAKANNVRDISSAHQLQCIDKKIKAFTTSSEGYKE